MVGVRIGDMGIDKDGKPKANFQPGMDIFAKVTVLGEGVRGTLAKQLIERFELAGHEPADLRDRHQGDLAHRARRSTVPGRVVHGMAFPRDPERTSTACGSTT